MPGFLKSGLSFYRGWLKEVLLLVEKNLTYGISYCDKIVVSIAKLLCDKYKSNSTDDRNSGKQIMTRFMEQIFQYLLQLKIFII